MSQGPPPTPPQQGITATSQPFPGSLTPGWNDPPSIQYSPQTNNAAGRTKLNKRVPFPLQQGLPATTTTKPTAIVQPCQVPTLGISGGSSNIAVVHPMQYPNQATPPNTMNFPTLPTNTGVSTPYTLPRPESSQTPPPTSCASGSLPTMSVPAVPRQSEDINHFEHIENNASVSTSSAIQHI